MKLLRNLTLEITNKCLQNCIHCSSASCSDSFEWLKYQQAMSIIHQACRLGLRRVSISGGEPFLHPQLDFLVQDMTKTYELDVTVYSCGIVGNANCLESISTERFLKLKKVGAKNIIFSLHGIGNVCDQMTDCENSFNLIAQSIKNAIEAEFKPELHFVPTTININDFQNVVEFVYNYGIRKISILRLVPQGRATISLVPNGDEIVELLNNADACCLKFPDLKIRKGHPWKVLVECNCDNTQCMAGEDKLVVMANGKVLPCEAFKFKFESAPIISDSNLQKIWDEDELLEKIRLLNLVKKEIIFEKQWRNGKNE